MIEYTKDDLKNFESLSKALRALVQAARAMPSSTQSACKQMDEAIREAYAIRMNRIISMAIAEDKRPSLKRPLTLADLKEGLEHYVAEDGQDRMRPKQ